MGGLTERILATYVSVRASMRREIDAWHSEGQLLFYVFLACLLWFVAGLPFAFQSAGPGIAPPVAGVLAARLFASLILIPFVLYTLAGVSRIVSRLFGGQGSFINARLAIFWAFLASMPVVLALSLFGALSIILFGFNPAIVGMAVGLVQFSVIIGLWAACLAESEEFEREARVLVFMLSPVVLGFLLQIVL